MTNLPELAREIAFIAHRNQRRKYTNEPYFVHLAQVAGLVSTVPMQGHLLDRAIAVAYLHDIIEDQDWEQQDLVHLVNKSVADDVWLLTEPKEGNRAARKAAVIEKLRTAPVWVQTVKCADIISNTLSIATHDPKFGIVYCKEIETLLNELRGADTLLLDLARETLKEAQAKIEEYHKKVNDER